MVVALRYKLLTLLTLLPPLTLFTRFKQLWSKKALMPIHMANMALQIIKMLDLVMEWIRLRLL